MPSRAASRRADASSGESPGLAPGTTRIVTRWDAKHPAEKNCRAILPPAHRKYGSSRTDHASRRLRRLDLDRRCAHSRVDRRLSNELGKGLRRRHHRRCRARSRVDHAALACKPLAVGGHYKPLCACVDRQWALLCGSAAKVMCEGLQPTIDCSWKPFSTDIEPAFPGGISRSVLAIGRSCISALVDGRGMEFRGYFQAAGE